TILSRDMADESLALSRLRRRAIRRKGLLAPLVLRIHRSTNSWLRLLPRNSQSRSVFHRSFHSRGNQTPVQIGCATSETLDIRAIDDSNCRHCRGNTRLHPPPPPPGTTRRGYWHLPQAT